MGQQQKGWTTPKHSSATWKTEDEKWMKNGNVSKTDTMSIFEKWMFFSRFSPYFWLHFSSHFSEKWNQRWDQKWELWTPLMHLTKFWLFPSVSFFWPQTQNSSLRKCSKHWETKKWWLNVLWQMPLISWTYSQIFKSNFPKKKPEKCNFQDKYIKGSQSSWISNNSANCSCMACAEILISPLNCRNMLNHCWTWIVVMCLWRHIPASSSLSSTSFIL